MVHSNPLVDLVRQALPHNVRVEYDYDAGQFLFTSYVTVRCQQHDTLPPNDNTIYTIYVVSVPVEFMLANQSFLDDRLDHFAGDIVRHILWLATDKYAKSIGQRIPTPSPVVGESITEHLPGVHLQSFLTPH
jgi:hypothetical protein